MFEFSLYQLQIVTQYPLEYVAFSVHDNTIFDVDTLYKFRVLGEEHVDVEDFWRCPRVKIVRV